MKEGPPVDFWSSIASTAERWNVLEHSFYVRWSAGELERDELTLYAGQYAHAVRALAEASRHAADIAPAPVAAELSQHAAEEENHVELWAGFAGAVGAAPDAPPLERTVACAQTWGDRERDLLATLVALYAVESAQPAISRAKAAGLREHYEITATAATAYFDEHAVRDIEHAQAARKLIDARLEGADTEALLREAERVLAANWRLLDGVEQAYASAR
jgi:pyrroloquinoline-quinone synthase